MNEFTKGNKVNTKSGNTEMTVVRLIGDEKADGFVFIDVRGYEGEKSYIDKKTGYVYYIGDTIGVKTVTITRQNGVITKRDTTYSEYKSK